METPRPPRLALLTRLLIVASPTLALGCDTAGSPAGSAGSPSSTRARAMRTITPPSPPLKPHGPVPSASAPELAPRPDDKPMSLCGADYRSWPQETSGGPYAMAQCYTPPQGQRCLEATSPPLHRLLGARGRGNCIYDGPHEQKDPASGAPWCCYNVGYMGDGRPLFVGREQRRARLGAPGSRWC